VRTLIHIGLPRTASTFLQRQVFPKITGFDFIGVDKTFYSKPFQKLLYQDESLYKELGRNELIDSKSENILLSNELFCGQSLGMNSTNRTRTVLRLKKVFPEAEIILVLRNQLSLLESLYSIAVYGGYSKRPEDFIKLSGKEREYDTFTPNEHAESFLLTPLVRLYQEYFSKVYVFLFEDFTSGPDAFFEKFKSEIGIELPKSVAHNRKENKSLSQRQIRYFRRMNRTKPLLEQSSLGSGVFRRKLWFGEHILGGKKRFQFSEKLSSDIREFYKEDNMALMTHLPELEDSPNYLKYYSY
jgi:hypothetical protein